MSIFRRLKGKEPFPKYYEPFSAPSVKTSDESLLRTYDHEDTTLQTMWNHVQNTGATTVPRPVIPKDWNKKVPDKLNPADGRDIMAEIEWEYSPEGSQELKHLFALWHLNDEVWQRQRKKAINLAVYGEEDPFDEAPYYHVISISDDYGIMKDSFPKHEKEKARSLYEQYTGTLINPKWVLFVEGNVEIGGHY